MLKKNLIKNTHNPLWGALWMVLAGISFAVINVFTQWVAQTEKTSSTFITFYQYFFALLFFLPGLFKQGLSILRTRQLGLHIFRIALAVVGTQFWVYGLVHQIPIWQGIALLMTSPLFAIIGSAIFLKEKVSSDRWLATFFGFVGAMIILEPWSDTFTWVAVTPMTAAFFWAGYSLMSKKQLTLGESPSAIVVFLFLLTTPFNFVMTLGNLSFHSYTLFGYLLLLGFLTMLAQMFIAKAYACADASYIQPFDYLKLPVNVLAGIWVFGWFPPGRLWLGAFLIVGVSFYITRKEGKENEILKKNKNVVKV